MKTPFSTFSPDASAHRHVGGAGELLKMLLGAPLVWLIRGYQLFISPLLLPCCRFTPTCSQYAIDAIRLHGPLRGVFLAAWRLLRCHPFSRGGFDPVMSISTRKVEHGN